MATEPANNKALGHNEKLLLIASLGAYETSLQLQAGKTKLPVLKKALNSTLDEIRALRDMLAQ